MGYDFSVLSPADFEDLSRDLLQAELGIRLEAFTVGRDGGTDLRYSVTRDRKWVVQCKHFARSGWRGLVAQLKREASKVARLAPERYILTTSVGLTPANKDEAVALLSPWLKSSEDVLGADDLRNLLTKHPRVERSHFKLWLASTAVLEKVLHAATFVRTESLVAELQRQVRLYVSNESFGRALDILTTKRVCIIAGIPGIGKTFLARMLMLHHLQQNFDSYAVSADIDEANRVYRPTDNQFFYYDDFLGTAFDEAPSKNEDARLADFLQRVARAPNKRLVLTTREYILRRAMTRYEHLHRALEGDLQCVVRLEDYTRLVRGKVIYNHLFFSDLDRGAIRSFCQGRRYQRAVQHPNFSPRLIEFAIRQGEKEHMLGGTFDGFVQKVLDTPATLWDHAFRSQLSSESQSVLLAMVFLPGRTPVDDLSVAAACLAAVRSGTTPAGLQLTAQLKHLDGTFVTIEPIGDALRGVRYTTPAIADYLLGILDESPEEVNSAVRGARFFEQLLALWSAAQTVEGSRGRYPGISRWIRENGHVFAEALQRTIDGTSCLWQERTYPGGRGLVRVAPNQEMRLSKLLGIARAAGLSTLGEWAEARVRGLTDAWVRREGDRTSAAELISMVTVDQSSREAVKAWSLADIEDAEDFEAALQLYETDSDLADEKFVEALSEAFDSFVQSQVEYILEDANDASAAEAAMADVEDIARRLGMSPPWDEEELRVRIARLEARDDEFDPDLAKEAHSEIRGSGNGPADDARIDLLFDSLARSVEPEEDDSE